LPAEADELVSPFELKSTLSREHRSKGVRPHSTGTADRG
jgi:hypothetical protein